MPPASSAPIADPSDDVANADPRAIATLLKVMARLRDPETGCPWDIEQSFASIAPYTVEEAYEVADAIQRDDIEDLCDELGDLLLQVVFHAQMAAETGLFAFDDVVEAINIKMIRRHPHVFGDVDRDDAEAVKQRWETIKAEEKAEKRARKGAAEAPSSAVDGVPPGMNGMKRALKIQQKLSRVGFDWSRPEPVLDKLREETGEIEEALAGGDRRQIESEIGDLLFVAVNLARLCDIDPEAALAHTNAKVIQRFQAVEAELANTEHPVGLASLEDMEAAWQRAKAR